MFTIDNIKTSNDIELYRNHINFCNKSFIAEEAIEYNIDSFKIEDNHHRYNIKIDNTIFKILFIKRPSNKLVILLRSGISNRYPTFTRWSYYNLFDGNVLCVDDPMYEDNYNNDIATWYYGNNELSLLNQLKFLIDKIILQCHIDKYSIFFIGSSAGGYAALYMANLCDFSIAIALNPQFVLKNWTVSRSKEKFLKKGINFNEQDKYKRNFLELSNKKSIFFIAVNSISPFDYTPQFIPFAKQHNIIPKYGLNKYGNIITWLHATHGENPHTCNPEKIAFKIIELLIQKIIKNEPIEDFKDFFFYISEYENENFILKAQISKFKHFNIWEKILSECSTC